MSALVTGWVLAHSPVTGASRLVLFVLADHADSDGRNTWPAVSTIAWEARCSESTVHRVLRELEADGRIAREGKTEYRTVRYRVLMDRPQMRPSQDRTLPGSDPGPSQDRTQDPPRIGDKPSKEPSKEPSKNEDTREATELFEDDISRVLARLTALGRRRGCAPPTRAAVESVLSAYPEVDHDALLAELEFWAEHGSGKRRTIKSLIGTYRTFAKGAERDRKAVQTSPGTYVQSGETDRDWNAGITT